MDVFEDTYLIDTSSYTEIIDSDETCEVFGTASTGLIISKEALNNIDLKSVPYVIQKAIDEKAIDIKAETLGDEVIQDIKTSFHLFKEGVYSKEFINQQITFLENSITKKISDTQLTNILHEQFSILKEELASNVDIKTLNSRIDKSQSNITKLLETINTKDTARAKEIEEVEARVNENLSHYSNALDLTIDENGNASAEKIDELKISINDQEGDLNALKKQVDGKVEYFEGAYSAVKEDFKPALVEPYKTWYETDIANGNTTLRDIHTGDTFEQYEVVNNVNEYKASWKFVKTALNYPNADEHGYCWSVMTNSVALDAYKKAIQAHQAIEQQEVKITDVRNIAQKADGKWTANADILITNPNGKLTGIEIDADNEGDGIKIHSSKLTLLDNGKKPFRYENGELTLNAKTTFSNVKDVPDFAKKSDIKKGINLIPNNFSLTGTNTGWSPSFPINQVTKDGDIKAMDVNSNGSTMVITDDFIEIDPEQAYKFSLSLYTQGSTGSRYFGLYIYDEDKNIISDLRHYGTETKHLAVTHSNFYFWYGSPFNIWQDMEGYLYPRETDLKNVNTGKNVNNFATMPKNTRYVKFRFLNYYNKGVANRTLFYNPSIVPIEINTSKKVADINWQVEVQKAMNDDKTTVDGSSIITGSVGADKIDVNAITGKNITGGTINGTKLNGVYIHGSIISATFIDKSSSALLTDWVSILFQNIPSLYRDNFAKTPDGDTLIDGSGHVRLIGNENLIAGGFNYSSSKNSGSVGSIVCPNFSYDLYSYDNYFVNTVNRMPRPNGGLRFQGVSNNHTLVEVGGNVFNGTAILTANFEVFGEKYEIYIKRTTGNNSINFSTTYSIKRNGAVLRASSFSSSSSSFDKQFVRTVTAFGSSIKIQVGGSYYASTILTTSLVISINNVNPNLSNFSGNKRIFGIDKLEVNHVGGQYMSGAKSSLAVNCPSISII